MSEHEPVKPIITGGLEGVPFRLPRPPFWMIFSFLLLVVLTWVPLALIALARTTTSTKPRVHVFQDMDVQPRFEAQDVNPIFLDNRAMRQPIPGTVAFGQLDLDDHYHRGFTRTRSEDGQWQVHWHDGFPEQVDLDERLMERGQRQFNIYCATCHGRDGYGRGPTAVRAEELRQALPIRSLHSDSVRQREDGHLYNTVTHGYGNMRGYGKQIKTEDRWAIVAYLRALQVSQNAPLEAVPREMRDRLAQ